MLWRGVFEHGNGLGELALKIVPLLLVVGRAGFSQLVEIEKLSERLV